MDSMDSMMRVCSKDGCEMKHYAKGFCAPHYRQIPEVRLRRNKSNKKYNSKPESKLRRNKYIKKYNSKPENKLKKKEYDRKYVTRPEVKLRHKEYMKNYRLKPEVKLKEKQNRDNPENKLKKKEYQKKYNSKPESKLKRIKRQSRPENKLKNKIYQQQHPEVNLKSQRKHFKKLCSVLGIFPTVKLHQLYISWSKTVRKILGNYCHVCGSTKQIEIHHIFHKVKYPLLSLNENNGIPLCRFCHYQAHGKLLIQPLQNFPS